MESSSVKRVERMVKLIEAETVTRAYDFRGTDAIVESDGNRLLICDGFGGVDSLRGGAVRWEHGLVIRLQPDDTIESLKRAMWNECTSHWLAIVSGYDRSRPILLESPVKLAAAAGLR